MKMSRRVLFIAYTWMAVVKLAITPKLIFWSMDQMEHEIAGFASRKSFTRAMYNVYSSVGAIWNIIGALLCENNLFFPRSVIYLTPWKSTVVGAELPGAIFLRQRSTEKNEATTFTHDPARYFVSKGPKTNIFAQKKAQLHTLELIF